MAFLRIIQLTILAGLAIYFADRLCEQRSIRPILPQVKAMFMDTYGLIIKYVEDKYDNLCLEAKALQLRLLAVINPDLALSLKQSKLKANAVLNGNGKCTRIIARLEQHNQCPATMLDKMN